MTPQEALKLLTDLLNDATYTSTTPQAVMRFQQTQLAISTLEEAIKSKEEKKDGDQN